jgi:hypothetical protein
MLQFSYAFYVACGTVNDCKARRTQRGMTRHLLYVAAQNVEKCAIFGEELAGVKEEAVRGDLLRPLPPHAQRVSWGHAHGGTQEAAAGM